MPQAQAFNPLVLVKFVLWLALVAVATVLLARRKMTARLRLYFIVGGVLLFGVGFGLLLYPGLNPNPPSSLRTLLTSLLVRGNVVPAVAGMLVVLLLVSWISNKSICGYGCQLGLLQDLLHRVPLSKWQPPFWLSNSVRIVAFVGLLGGLALAGLDWIGVVDPFRLFQFDLTLPIAATVGLIVAASLFVYRPWCRFLCPFGLVSWGVEQVSVYRPRIDRDACKGCQLCVKACPSGAMADFYADNQLHADCFACGACIDACPVNDVLNWRRKD
ncbi:MAG: 4Fe-4S binding protein [Anaerolineae bacterium]